MNNLTPPSTLPTFVESGLGQWMVHVHVQQNDRMERTETEPNWKRFFDAYCMVHVKKTSVVLKQREKTPAWLSFYQPFTSLLPVHKHSKGGFTIYEGPVLQHIRVCTSRKLEHSIEPRSIPEFRCIVTSRL